MQKAWLTLVWSLCVLIALLAPEAHALGTLIPAQARRDMVHDGARDRVYITNGAEVLRYDVGSQTFVSPIPLGGNLIGMDLSVDGKTLAVADGYSDGTSLSVYLVSLDDLDGLAYTAIRKMSTPLDFYEGGAWSVAFASNNHLYVTSQFLGSGWVPMRWLDIDTGVWTPIASVRQNSMVSASGDAQTIAFAESNISDGEWGLVDVPTGGIVRRYGYTNGTSWFNFEIASDSLGAQFAIPTYGGTFVYDDVYQKVAKLGTYAGPQPIGGAYHPVQRLAYFPWAQTREVRVVEMDGFTTIASLDFENDFSFTGNSAYGGGRTRISRDGSLLMVSVSGGVRILRMYAPLDAPSAVGRTLPNSTVSMPLPGTIGNGDTLGYSLAEAPQHGRASIYGDVITYRPAPNFVGTDTLRYRAQYGLAWKEGVLTIVVDEENSIPTAHGVDRNNDPLRVAALQIPSLRRTPVKENRFVPLRPAAGTAPPSSGAQHRMEKAVFRGTVGFR